MSEREIKIFTDVEKLNEFAAQRIVEICNEAIGERGQFTIALSGGSTPKALYKMLASEKLDWSKVFFFFGDERNVPPDSDESNFKMANEALFKSLNIDESKIYHWLIERESPEKIAEDYAAKLEFFFKGFPKFDLILLGMGGDGHTASLFPFTKALGETEKIATENWVEKLGDWRFTLTFRTINNARNVIFLIAGEDKAEALREVLQGDGDAEKFPSKLVKPTGGKLLFLLDEKATRLL